MADYTKTTDFAAKDALASGNANKVITGTEHDDEYNNIATAIATKYDSTDKNVANGIAGLDASALLLPAVIPDATTSAKGGLETATNSEASAGTALDKIITPGNLGANAGILADIIALAAPAGDRILFWDDSASTAAYLTVSTGLTISGTSLITNDSQINHDSLSGFVSNEHVDHTTINLTAGNGLTGGGNISASRTFNVGAGSGISVAADSVAVDISGLTNMDIADTAATDSILVNDGGTMKQMDIQDMGVRVVESTVSQTFALGDANTLQLLTQATDRTFDIPVNSSVAFPIGAIIYVGSRDTATLTISPNTSAVRLTSINGSDVGPSAGDVNVSAGGMAAIVKVATNEWMIAGDIE